jgi:hypothetical protein
MCNRRLGSAGTRTVGEERKMVQDVIGIRMGGMDGTTTTSFARPANGMRNRLAKGIDAKALIRDLYNLQPIYP